MYDGLPCLGGIPLPLRIAKNREGRVVKEVDIARTEMLAAHPIKGDTFMAMIQLDIILENPHITIKEICHGKEITKETEGENDYSLGQPSTQKKDW